MMKFLALAGLLGMGLSTVGCTAHVKTYDAAGRLTGECTSYKGLFFGGGATCVGYTGEKPAGEQAH